MHDLVGRPAKRGGNRSGALTRGLTRSVSRAGDRPERSTLAALAFGGLALVLWMLRWRPRRTLPGRGRSASSRPRPHDIDQARREERHRLAQTLHNSLSPNLAALQLRMQSAVLLVRDRPEQAAELFTESVDDVNSSLEELRHTLRGLRYAPRRGHRPARERTDLAGFLHMHTKALSQASAGRTRFTCKITGDASVLPPRLQSALRGVAGEAVANAARHSGAEHCHTDLTVSRDTVCLTVTDDGVGIASDATSGLGLPSMCREAHEHGGTFSVTHRHPHGTVVRVRLPLPVH